MRVRGPQQLPPAPDEDAFSGGHDDPVAGFVPGGTAADGEAKIVAEDALSGGQAALDEAGALTAPPGALDAPEAGAGGVSIGDFTSGASASVGRATASGSVDGAVSTSGGGVGADVSLTGDGVARSGSVSFSPGWISIGAGEDRAISGGGARHGGVTVGAGLDSFSVGVDVARTSAAGFTVGGDVTAYLSLDRDAADLGDYEGDDPALRGTRKVEITKSLGGTPMGTLGAVVGSLGFAGRLAGGKARSVTYRTHLLPEKARSIVREGRGAVQFVHDKLRAAGLAGEPLDIPDLSRPDTLKTGDELIVTTSGSVTTGLALGVAGAGVGVHGTVQGDLEIAARRLDQDRIELVVTPRKVRGIQISGGAPLLLQGALDRTTATAMRQAFVFDLTRPEARAAYAQALAGEFPGGPSLAATDVDYGEGRVAALETWLEREQLPGGVERSFVEDAHVRRDRAGGGVNWGPIHRLWGMAGLTFHRSRTDVERTVTDGKSTFRTSMRGIEDRRQVLLSGTESLGVSASLRRITAFDPAGRRTERFAGLHLAARFSDDTVRGFELNDEVVGKINDAFGTGIPPFSLEGRKESREVSVERRLGSEDLAMLGEASLVMIELIADRTGADRGGLRKLVTDLGVGDAVARADRVTAYIQEEGLTGMAALHGLLGGRPEALTVATASDAYTAPLEQATELDLAYRDPIDADTGKGDLTRRFQEVEEVLERVAHGLEALADDPILDEDGRTPRATALLDAQAALEDLVALDHLDPAARQGLHDRLDRGWTTALQARIMERLVPPSDSGG